MPTKVNSGCWGAKSKCGGACGKKSKSGCPYGNIKVGKHGAPMIVSHKTCDTKCKQEYPHQAPCTKACMKATGSKTGYIQRS